MAEVRQHVREKGTEKGGKRGHRERVRGGARRAICEKAHEKYSKRAGARVTVRAKSAWRKTIKKIGGGGECRARENLSSSGERSEWNALPVEAGTSWPWSDPETSPSSTSHAQWVDLESRKRMRTSREISW